MHPEVLTAKKWYIWLWLSPLLTIPSFVFLMFIEVGYELICYQYQPGCNYALADLVSGLIAILGSALWHLVLLVPALNKQSEFVRWHGRQALLLAGIRTAIPVAFLFFDFVAGGYGCGVLLAFLVLIPVWLIGTAWGHNQAVRGDCALMRWTGHGAGLPLPTGTVKPTVVPALAPLIQERPHHRTAYYQGLSLREQGKSDEAAHLFHTLLVSDASPEFKGRVTEELKQLGETYENLTADVLVAIFRFSHDSEQRRKATAVLESLGLVEAL